MAPRYLLKEAPHIARRVAMNRAPKKIVARTQMRRSGREALSTAPLRIEPVPRNAFAILRGAHGRPQQADEGGGDKPEHQHHCHAPGVHFHIEFSSRHNDQRDDHQPTLERSQPRQ